MVTHDQCLFYGVWTAVIELVFKLLSGDISVQGNLGSCVPNTKVNKTCIGRMVREGRRLFSMPSFRLPRCERAHGRYTFTYGASSPLFFWRGRGGGRGGGDR